jgi:hypothetical protein
MTHAEEITAGAVGNGIFRQWQASLRPGARRGDIVNAAVSAFEDFFERYPVRHKRASLPNASCVSDLAVHAAILTISGGFASISIARSGRKSVENHRHL